MAGLLFVALTAADAPAPEKKKYASLKEFLGEARVQTMVQSADGKRIVTREWNGTFRAWDAQTGKEITGDAPAPRPKPTAPKSTIDLLEVSLAVSRDVDPAADLAAAKAALDAIEADVRKAFPRGKPPDDPTVTIAILNRILFDTRGFRHKELSAEDPAPYASLAFVLARKEGNCVGLSVLYLLLGDRLGLTLAPARVPGHVWLKCLDTDPSRNIETTAKGAGPPDDLYQKMLEKSAWAKAKREGYRVPLSRDALHADVLASLALSAREAGDLPKAADFLRRAVALDDGYLEARNNLALLLRKLGKPKEALAAYDELVARAPAYPSAYNNRGVTQLDLKDLDGALADFKKAVDLDPHYTDARANLGATHLARGEGFEALNQLERALDEDPANAGVAVLLMRVKEIAPAAWADAMKKRCEGWLALAESYLKNNSPDGAEPPLRRILALYPESDYAKKAKAILAGMGKTGP
ncbi:MAG: tetratricopeptide repeat protein [Planctomycetota bacterium]